MASRHLAEHSRTNCVEKIFIEAFKYQKNTKFIQNCPKLATSNFCCFSCQYFETKNDCEVDKKLRNFPSYQK